MGLTALFIALPSHPHYPLVLTALFIALPSHPHCAIHRTALSSLLTHCSLHSHLSLHSVAGSLLTAQCALTTLGLLSQCVLSNPYCTHHPRCPRLSLHSHSLLTHLSRLLSKCCY